MKNGKWTGKGIGICFLDTGIVASHPDFDRRVTGFMDFVKGRTIAYDDNGHGTHVAGLAAGSGRASGGRVMGIAPESHLVSLKVLDKKGNGTVETVTAGLNWLSLHHEEWGIRIVNISVGAMPKNEDEEHSSLVQMVEKVWDSGLVVVVAAGNLGPKQGSITTPGISRKVITVGCFDDTKATDVGGTRLIHYSGRGPTGVCIVKPEIVMPGTGQVSCNALYGRGQRAYCIKSGTSMATPVVSGAIALLLEKEPELTNAEVKLRLKGACESLGLPMSHQGWGRLNIAKLLS